MLASPEEGKASSSRKRNTIARRYLLREKLSHNWKGFELLRPHYLAKKNALSIFCFKYCQTIEQNAFFFLEEEEEREEEEEKEDNNNNNNDDNDDDNDDNNNSKQE